MKYRRRVEEVEAFHWQGQPVEEWPPFMRSDYDYRGNRVSPGLGTGDALQIPSPGSFYVVPLGDWVVLDAEGNLSPCPAAAFEARWEEVRDIKTYSQAFRAAFDDSHP